MDWHWDRIVAGAVLTTLLGVGAESAAPENRQDGNRIVIAGRDSAQDSINQVGQEITRRNMNIQPTLKARIVEKLNEIRNSDTESGKAEIRNGAIAVAALYYADPTWEPIKACELYFSNGAVQT